MKKTNKLNLSKETIRALGSTDLKEVAGGSDPLSRVTACIECTTADHH